MDRDRDFGEFVDARALVMRRTAFLLCGDWHRAEDIVQTALTKLYVAWPRVRRDSLDAYSRKVLVRTAIDESRRGFFQRERSVDVVPERAVSDHATDYDLREALDALPPGQRAVVVLRYWEDLSITETARILGRTEGTVKSQAAKGLAALRDLLVDEPRSGIHRDQVIRAGKAKLARRRTAIATAMAAVLVFSLGTVAYLARPRAASGPGAAYTKLDRNAELSQILRNADILPPGVTAEDVPEIQAKAFEFHTRDSGRWAVARLRDSQGTGGITIWLERTRDTSVGGCENAVDECQIVERNGIKVRVALMKFPNEKGQRVWYVDAVRPDGTRVDITNDNVGQFRTDHWGKANLGSAAQRTDPLLDSEALIKIATLPGLTF